MLRRWLTPAGNQTNVSVTLAAVTHSIVFARAEQDTAYGVTVTPNWSTTSAVTTKLTTGCTITFGTGAPANAVIDICTFRAE